MATRPKQVVPLMDYPNSSNTSNNTSTNTNTNTANAASPPHSPYFLFIRGLARHSKHWATLTDSLEQRFGPHHLEFIDLPGNGTRIDETSYLKISDYVHDLQKKSHLIKTGIKPILVTISMGSMIGLNWISHFPDQIKGLVIINSSASKVCPTWQRLKPQTLQKFLKILFTSSDNSLSKEQTIIKLTTFQWEHTLALAPTFSKWPLTRVSNFLRQIYAANRFRLPTPTPEMSKKIEVWVGARDQLVHPDCSRLISQKLSAPLVIHPNAGHDIALDDPRWVLDQLVLFNNKLNHLR